MVYISVDVEASGPLPGFFDLLSLGAVAVARAGGTYEPRGDGLYLELQPLLGALDPQAMAVNRLDLERLRREGLGPEEAARRVERWLRGVASPADPPVFVGYCANFDWAFVNDLFHRAGIENPFGYKALDIRSLALGVLDLDWQELRQERILPLLGLEPLAAEEAHNALADARHQARMLARLLEIAAARTSPDISSPVREDRPNA
ncbi:MAG: 3'-5' exonuclease [Planctomycetes bacterium]|nr:3'-5' exonuclease [Planctomycetota bacterium]